MGVYNIQENVNDWDIRYEYSIGTNVNYNGKNYIALKSVPKGINIGYDEYWKEVVDNPEIDEIYRDLRWLDVNVSADKSDCDTSVVEVSGNPIEFTCERKQIANDVEVEVEPIQDLNGYSYPWVGGAGKNLLDVSTFSNQSHLGVDFTKNVDSSGNIWGIYTNHSATADISLTIKEFTLQAGTYRVVGTPSGGGANTYFIRVGKQNDSYICADLGSGENFTLSEDTTIRVKINIKSGVDVSNLLFKLMVTTDTSASYNSFAPYTNICPISGRTEIGILGCGKNLANQNGTNTDNGYVHSSFINADGEVQSALGSWDILEYIMVKPSTTYKISGLTVTSVNGYAEYDINKSMVAHGVISSNPFTLVTSANTKYIRINRKYDTDLTVQVEESTQTTTYSPYTESNDLTISLGQTVYGGTLDLENGVLVVTYKKIVLSTSSQLTNFVASSQYGAYAKIQNTNDCLATDTSKVYGYCSMCEYVSRDNCLITANQNRLWSDDYVHIRASVQSNVSTVEELFTIFKDAEICYEVATPINVNLKPEQIKLLQGVNNISTSGDNIKLKYRKGKVLLTSELNNIVSELTTAINYEKGKVNTLTNHLTAEDNAFVFMYDESTQKYGYYVDDVFTPFAN